MQSPSWVKKITPRLQKLMDLMQGGEWFAIEDVMIACECSYKTASKMLNELRLEKKTRICEWRKSGKGPAYPVHCWGYGEDKRKPRPKSNAQICKKWRNSEDGQVKLRSYGIAKWARQKAESVGLKGIDPMLAAIIGKPQQRSI